jgi:plastocyanin
VKGGAILVEGVTRGKKGGSDVVVETQKCHFVSHVMTTGPGDHVRVKNSDAVLHNTHGFLGKATVFNVALPHKDQMVDITRRLTTPGVVRVLCDAHPHMRAWIVVHDSPYFAVTDDRGAFKIDGVPPGTYKVTLWHEAFRTVTKTVLIAANGSANLDFELK